ASGVVIVVSRSLSVGESSPPARCANSLSISRLVDDPHALFESEYNQQYRSLPFWKRTVILLAGIAVNLLFAVLVFVVVYSIVGVDMTNSQTGEVSHITMSPLRSVEVGFAYIGAVVQMVVSLFNPQTAADVVSNSTSVVGIAVMSKTYAEAGLLEFVFFMAMLSVSLGIMNLLPIPPLDGGRFVIEIFQKLTRKNVSTRALSYMSAAGMILFLGFFAIMVNQDVQRFVFGNWG
uniref:site-2 protease family protein n=1 Tax=Ellagibacter isourolithinifaciens TaxID=2137581 RepID=UPI003AAC4553